MLLTKRLLNSICLTGSKSKHLALFSRESRIEKCFTRGLVGDASFKLPENEQILEYCKEGSVNSKHRLDLEKCLAELQEEVQEIPIVINGKRYTTDEVRHQLIPFNHSVKLARFYYADHKLIRKALNVACDSQRDWMINVSVDKKLDMLEKAANLVSGKYRQRLNAATMLGQAKTIKQAEIDAAAEMADFFRLNAHYMRLLSHWQPRSTPSEKNSLHFRGIDGFVAAISPFNFTAIGGNLASAPTLMGNCVVWKPSDTAILSNYITFQILQEAGFPDGVINFVPCEGFDFGRVITSDSRLGGVNFTGSLVTFQWLWSEVGANIKIYNSFPRLIGECGGKNFHLIEKSADVDVVVAQTIRSAFEYSGQKCSACSRLYVPLSLWNDGLKDKLISITQEGLKIGPATDFSSYTSAVIDSAAYKRITSYINYANSSQSELNILCGGEANNEIGYYIKPTIIESTNPKNRLMTEEIFGPILTVYAYPDAEVDKVMDLIDENPFSLTGAIFSQDEKFIMKATDRLKMSAGNLYINDKSTGAVVGQQPFGGSRRSGTNDKAGGPHYLMRWCNQQTIKRTTEKLTSI